MSVPHVVVAWGPDHDTAERDLVACCLRVLDVEPDGITTARACPRCGSDDHGRPYLRRDGTDLPLGFSLSRSDGVLAVAVSDGADVGVDVESPGRTAFDGFDDVVLHDGEPVPATARDRAVLWARKEAHLKATGVGLATDPRTVELHARSSYRYADLALVPEGLVGAVAVETSATPRLTLVAGGPGAAPRPASFAAAPLSRLRSGP